MMLSWKTDSKARPPINPRENVEVVSSWGYGGVEWNFRKRNNSVRSLYFEYVHLQSRSKIKECR